MFSALPTRLQARYDFRIAEPPLKPPADHSASQSFYTRPEMISPVSRSSVRCGSARIADPPLKPPTVVPDKHTGPSCHKAVADVYAVPNYNPNKISKIGEVVVFAVDKDHLDARMHMAHTFLKTQERHRNGRTIILGEKAVNKTKERCLDSCSGGEFFETESGKTRALF